LYYCGDYSQYSVNKSQEELNKQEKEVLKLVRKGRRLYDYIWEQCSDKEKYLLFDFAFDGLINFKNTNEIYGLIAKGVFVIHHQQIKLFSPGFRAYLITKYDSGEVIELRKKYKQNSTWQSLRGPLLLLLLGFACVIFFTQETAFQKLLALAGGVGTLLTIIPKIIAGSSGKSAEIK
jgi:hypothetical protein